MGVSIVGPRVLRPRPAGSSRGTKTRFVIIRVSKTDHFRNGSGSSDPNRPKILKITVSYHMELGGVFKMPPAPSPQLLTRLRSGGHLNY